MSEPNLGPSASDKIADLRRRKAAAKLAGGEERIARQHARGRMTARERLELLLDKGSFREMDVFVTHNCDRLWVGGSKDSR